MLKLKSWGVCNNRKQMKIEDSEMNNNMTKAAMLHQIRNLTASQCRQLGVAKAFDGAPALKAVTAWLGDSQLFGEDGESLDIEAIFAEGDPAEVILHSGMAAPAEEEAPAEEAPAEEAPAEEQLAMRSLVQSEVARQKSANKTRIPLVTSTPCKSKWYKDSEGQKLAGMWMAANLWNRSEAKKWLKNNAPSGMKTAQNEGTANQGGNLVPDPLADAIVDVREEFGVARKVARMFQTSSDTLSVPTRSGGATVYYPAEAAAVTESNKTWGAVSCTIKKRAVLMSYSNELGMDSIVTNIADDLAEEVGRVLSLREDTELIQGDGTSSYGSVSGLDTASHTNNTAAGATWSAITLNDLVETAGTLGDKYHAGASWIMSRAFYTQVALRLMAAAGGNTLDSLGVGASGAQLLGYPIFFSDQAPTATATATECCWFGDWRGGVVMADRSGIQLATSEHVNFEKDQITIRATSRYDIQVHDSSAYVGLITTA